MEINKINNKIIQFNFNSKKELNLAFFRIQEFYESPYNSIKGKYFSVDEWLDVYSDDEGTINYFSYWEGVNLPVRILKEFEYIFDGELSGREKRIISAITNEQYVIGTVSSDELTLKHELSHALFYIDEEYKRKTGFYIELIAPEVLAELKRSLMDIEYSEEVIVDEMVAYIISHEQTEWNEIFPTVKFCDLHLIVEQLHAEFDKAVAFMNTTHDIHAIKNDENEDRNEYFTPQ